MADVDADSSAKKEQEGDTDKKIGQYPLLRVSSDKTKFHPFKMSTLH